MGLQSYCNVFVQTFGFMKGSKRLDDVTFGLWLRYMPSQMYASVFSYVSTSSNHILLMKSNRYGVKKQYSSCSSRVSAYIKKILDLKISKQFVPHVPIRPVTNIYSDNR